MFFIHLFHISRHQANVTVLKHGNVVSVARTPAGVGLSRITSLTTESGVTLGSAATVYIDGTYEGDLMARAGVSYTWGREANTTYNESYAGRRDPWGVQAVRNAPDVLMRDRCAPSHSHLHGLYGLCCTTKTRSFSHNQLWLPESYFSIRFRRSRCNVVYAHTDCHTRDMSTHKSTIHASISCT